MKRLFLSLLAGFAVMVSAQAEVFETQIEQTSGEDGAYAQFKLWIPPGTHPTRLIALTWGSNQCSLDVVNDLGWQNLAKATQSGLITCFFAPQTSTNHWDHAKGGSGQALLDALSLLAQMSKESQLANAQLYLVGDSQGGQFSFSFAGWKPDRVLGFVSVKGGRHDSSAIETAAQIPGLFFAGALDVPYRVENIKETFRQGRIRNAPWCLAIDKQGKHEPGPCAPLICAFLQELSGYPKDAILNSTVESGNKNSDSSLLSWFPNPSFKNEWGNFDSGKLVAGAPTLSFDSKMPSIAASSIPLACDLGAISAGGKDHLATVQITPGAQAQWDSVRVLDRPYLSDAVAVPSAFGSFSVTFKLNTQELPLGRFSGVIPLRFIQQNKPVLGALNIPVSATVIGDVTITPSLINLEPVNSRELAMVKIEIRSKSDETIKLLSFKAPRGVSLTSKSNSGSPLNLTLSFDRTDKDLATKESGTIWLNVETNQKWILRIPYFTSPTPQKS